MAVKEIAPQQAYEMLTKESGFVYIDVRTVDEFVSGHPDGAVNIPIAFHDPAQGMVPNRDFLSIVKAHYSKDQRLILGCQAGPRSQAAARLLQDAGYQDLSCVRGGFGGMRDRTGQLLAPGWAASGLPVSHENGEGISYESLAASRA